jgi:hypothetical protein
MDGKPGQPEEQERQRSGSAPGAESERRDADPDANANAAPAARETERLGPLSLRRMRKDDGRALIVYSRESPSA